MTPPAGEPAVPPPSVARLRRPPRPPGTAATLTRLATGAAAVGPASSARSQQGPHQGPQSVPVAEVQGALALDLLPPAPLPGGPAGPDAPAVLALVPEHGDDSTEEVRRWALRFAQAVVEVTGGDRPVTQLLRWTSRGVYADLDRRVRILARARPVGHGRRQGPRPQVHSVHLCQPTPTCAEVSVHVRYGPRSRAVAARLELRRGRWTCTALQLG